MCTSSISTRFSGECRRQRQLQHALGVSLRELLCRSIVRSRSLHNAKFDAKFIKHTLGTDLGGLFDTLLASQLIGAGDIEERHGLETVASRYLSEAVDKTERLSNWNLELSDSQLEYAARDAAVLLPLREKLIERLKSDSLDQGCDA